MTSRPLEGPASTQRPKHEPNPPGSGHLHLTSSSSRASFSTLLASYPLKLLTPAPLPSQPPNVAACYVLAYGGGLVAGDLVSLRVTVDEGCGLVLLTQGSTKIFKHRPGIRPLSHHSTRDDFSSVTRQRMHVTLAPRSFLLLLPDSASPFRGSRYAQAQRFVLDRSASVLVLDWVNSGRGQRPTRDPNDVEKGGEAEQEVWAMESYDSLNEIHLSGRLIMRDRLFLDNASSPVAPRMGPYNVYANVLILGPHLARLLKHLDELANRTRQFQVQRPPEVIWAFSPVEDGRGGVLRVAGVEVEDVRKWIRGTMEDCGVKELVGEGLWPRII